MINIKGLFTVSTRGVAGKTSHGIDANKSAWDCGKDIFRKSLQPCSMGLPELPGLSHYQQKLGVDNVSFLDRATKFIGIIGVERLLKSAHHDRLFGAAGTSLLGSLGITTFGAAGASLPGPLAIFILSGVRRNVTSGVAEHHHHLDHQEDICIAPGSSHLPARYVCSVVRSTPHIFFRRRALDYIFAEGPSHARGAADPKKFLSSYHDKLKIFLRPKQDFEDIRSHNPANTFYALALQQISLKNCHANRINR